MSGIHERSRLVRLSRTVRCVACGAPIHAGRRAWYASSREAGYRCESCGQHPAGVRTEYVPLHTKFAGTCHACGKAIEVGEMSWWRVRKPHHLLCPTCKGGDASGQQDRKDEPGEKGEPGDQQITRGTDGIDRITFGSVGEAVTDSLADYAQNDGNLSLIRANMARHLTGDDAWANYFTKAKLIDTIANPPKHLLDAVEEMRSKLMDDVAPPSLPKRRVHRNQEFGDELDPEAVLARSTTPWDRMMRETQPKHNVTIAVNLSVHTGRRAEHLLWRGAAAAALADILTQKGLNVQIVAYWSITHLSTRTAHIVGKYIVKQSDMPLDLGAVSVSLAEIAFARLVALYGLARHVAGTLDDCLGRCADIPWADQQGIDYLVEQSIIDREAAEDWLKAAVARSEAEAGVANG